jgi:hypothetical protein
MSKEEERCQRLRELEDDIAAQRKFIADLKSQGLDVEGERERFGELLHELDQELRASRAMSGAALR